MCLQNFKKKNGYFLQISFRWCLLRFYENYIWWKKRNMMGVPTFVWYTSTKWNLKLVWKKLWYMLGSRKCPLIKVKRAHWFPPPHYFWKLNSPNTLSQSVIPLILAFSLLTSDLHVNIYRLWNLYSQKCILAKCDLKTSTLKGIIREQSWVGIECYISSPIKKKGFFKYISSIVFYVLLKFQSKIHIAPKVTQ